MNPYVLVALAIIGVLAALLSLRAWIHRRGTPDPDAAAAAAAIDLPPAVSDPAGPDLEDRAVARLLTLPHFGRIAEGSIVDYYGGGRLTSCNCPKLPYPHLVLDTGGRQGMAFYTASALDQYVAVQEAVAAMLRAANSGSALPAREGSQ